MVGFLKLFRHIISNLPNRMKGSKTNLRIRMGKMLTQNWHHNSDFLRIVYIFTYLTKCHNTGVLVAPVSVILNRVNNKLSYQWQHSFFTDGGHHSVYTIFSEIYMVFFVICIRLKTFLWTQP